MRRLSANDCLGALGPSDERNDERENNHIRTIYHNSTNRMASVSENLIESCIQDNIEHEKCVVSQFRTSESQKHLFQQLKSSSSPNEIPIEWVIDIADESDGWFYGTAYHYHEDTRMLHVMVPDKENPSFDGMVLLDYRTVRLIECVDGQSDALFNKIMRDSIVKIKWDLEWFENEMDESGQPIVSPDEPRGRWIKSTARYYIRMANQLLVEENQLTSPTANSDLSPVDAIGYVMLAADVNVRLLNCLKDRGVEDFQRLITEHVTLFTPEAEEIARTLTASSFTTTATPGKKSRSPRKDSTDTDLNSPRSTSIRKLTDITMTLKDNITDIKDESQLIIKQRQEYSQAFYAYTLLGDLDAGMNLLADVTNYLDIPNLTDTITSSTTTTTATSNTTNNNNTTTTTHKVPSLKSTYLTKSPFDELTNNSIQLTSKLEKSMLTLLKQINIDNNNYNDIKLMNKNLKFELDEKDKLIKKLLKQQSK